MIADLVKISCNVQPAFFQYIESRKVNKQMTQNFKSTLKVTCVANLLVFPWASHISASVSCVLAWAFWDAKCPVF